MKEKIEALRADITAAMAETETGRALYGKVLLHLRKAHELVVCTFLEVNTPSLQISAVYLPVSHVIQLLIRSFLCH